MMHMFCILINCDSLEWNGLLYNYKQNKLNEAIQRYRSNRAVKGSNRAYHDADTGLRIEF